MSVLLAVIFSAGPGSQSILAYIDPGTGSMVFQVLAAAILSAGLFFHGLRIAIAGALARALGIRSKSAQPDAPVADVASVENTANPPESQLRRAA